LFALPEVRAQLAIADINNDGVADIISCSDGAPFAVRSAGGSTFTPAWQGPSVGCTAVTAGDRNSDGLAEVIVVTDQSPSLMVFDPRSLGGPIASALLPDGIAGTDVAIADLDADGLPEIVVLTSAATHVYDAATLTLKWTASGYGGAKMAIGDIDGDGHPDIIINNGSASYVLDAIAKRVKWSYPGGFGHCMAIGDVDNDGRAEIVFSNGFSSKVTILNGDDFTTATITTSGLIDSITIGDANNDGVKEIVIGHPSGSIEGRSVSGTKLWSIRSPGSHTQSVIVADVDRDGKREVLWSTDSNEGREVLFAGDANAQAIKRTGFAERSASVVNSVPAQDALTAGATSAGAGSTVAVPLYLQDMNGTPLGTDAGTGNRIQSISFQINFSPAVVTGISFTRAGALAGLTSSFEQTINGNGSIAWLASFVEADQPIPLTANAAPLGNRIGTLTVTLAGGLVDGSIVALPFNLGNTSLSNQGGTLSETTANSFLQVTNGSITIGGATTTTTLSAEPNPSGTGQMVTLTAAVNSGAAGPITGSVSFYDGVQLIGYGPVQSGQAMLTTSFPSLGTHNITATYEGDANFHPSTSAVMSQTVNPFATPTNVVATGTSSTTATITWTALGGATSYEVRRSVNGGAWILAGAPAPASFNDSGLTPNSEYLYVVRAIFGASGSSADSAPDVATTGTFADDPLVAGTTTIKAIHITELRTAANALRVTAGLTPVTFTDSALGPATMIRKVHIEELRSAILEARAIVRLPSLFFADAPLTAGTTPVKAMHIQQLRDALK
jgi:hypothetical protein